MSVRRFCVSSFCLATKDGTQRKVQARQCRVDNRKKYAAPPTVGIMNFLSSVASAWQVFGAIVVTALRCPKDELAPVALRSSAAGAARHVGGICGIASGGIGRHRRRDATRPCRPAPPRPDSPRLATNGPTLLMNLSSSTC